MEGIGARINAKLGPLPLWGWALLAVAALLAWMYIGKWGFFAPSTPQDNMAGDSSNPGMGSADYPAGLGGIAGAGTPAGSTDPTFSVPGAYSPGSGPFAVTDNAGNSLSASGNISSTPTVDLSGYSFTPQALSAPSPSSGAVGNAAVSQASGGWVGNFVQQAAANVRAIPSAVAQTVNLSGRRGGNIAQ